MICAPGSAWASIRDAAPGPHPISATALAPEPALTLIGTYGEVRTDYSADEPITSEAAKPYTAPPEPGKKRPSDAAMSGRVATLVLIVLAIFTYLFIRLAG